VDSHKFFLCWLKLLSLGQPGGKSDIWRGCSECHGSRKGMTSSIRESAVYNANKNFGRGRCPAT
ncbi:hypothetical protein J4732_18205, partial [Serratia marcescens]|nr:hypothetical protein [Serratia marcescens]